MDLNKKLEELNTSMNAVIRNWQEEMRAEFNLPAKSTSTIGISFDPSIRLDRIPSEPEETIALGAYVSNDGSLSVEVIEQKDTILTVHQVLSPDRVLVSYISVDLFAQLFKPIIWHHQV